MSKRAGHRAPLPWHSAGSHLDCALQHFHLDDCWAGPRNASGYLTPEADHFPNGMKPVIDYVHSKGLTFGLYTCGGERWHIATCMYASMLETASRAGMLQAQRHVWGDDLDPRQADCAQVKGSCC